MPDTPQTRWRLLRAGLRGSGPALRRLAAWSTVEALPALGAGWITAQAIDQGFAAGRPATGIGWLTMLAALYLLRAIAQRASFPYLADVVEPMRDRFARGAVDATIQRAIRDGRPDTAAVARVTRQLESVRQLVAALLRTARPLGFTIVAAVVGLATLSPALAALVVPPIVVALLILRHSLRRQFRLSLATMLADERVSTDTGTVLHAARDIAALGAENAATATVDAAARASARAGMAAIRAGQSRTVVVAIGGQVPILLLLTASGLLTGNRITVGQLIGAVATVVTQILPALQAATGATGAYLVQLGSTLARLAETTTDHTTERTVPLTAIPPAREDLVVTGLSFRYGPLAEPVLRDLSVTVRSGDHLAVVGASGIGKSTLAGLLAGVLAPENGTVQHGPHRLADLAPSHRASLVALLPQDAYVFTGTVRANLTYLRPDATDDDLDRAVRAVCAESLVERLGGWSGELTNPSAHLSAGERQLLVLVRAYLCAASVIILDEATCHLDPVAEARAELAFAARPETTLIVIAHRLSSAQRADRILLLDGKDPQIGSNADLLAGSPTYAMLAGQWTVPVAAG